MDPGEYARMDAVEGSMWWYRALHGRLRDAIGAQPGRLLDAGCGTGGFLSTLPAIDAIGLEWSPDGVARASGKTKAPMVRGSVNQLPFIDGCFDTIVSADVLCHAAVDPDAALAGFLTALRPGGRLILNMPAYAWLMSDHDRHVQNARRSTAQDLKRRLTQSGFVRVRAHYWNSLLLPAMILHRLVSSPNSSDVALFPPWLDAIFHGISELERRLPFSLPFGGSVLAIAEKP